MRCDVVLNLLLFIYHFTNNYNMRVHIIPYTMLTLCINTIRV